MNDNTLQSKVDTANTILALGQGYPFWDSVWAFLENAIDSVRDVQNSYPYSGYVPHVWIEARREHLIIWDNGTGMNPYMHPKAQSRIESYMNGDLPNVSNIWEDSAIDDSSRRSLQWMVQGIALSAKLGAHGNYQRGEKGTGSNAYLRLGEKVEIYTRPIEELSRAAYIPKDKDWNESYLLTRPTKSQLIRKDVSSTIVPYEGEFKDPFGKELQHGTIVVISNLDEGVPEQLTFKGLSKCVEKEAGEDSSLVEVCSFTDPSREVRGKWRTVTVTEKHGKRLLVTTLTNEEDMAAFAVNLYIDLSGKKKGVWVTKKGGKKFLITELPEFDCEPWYEIEGTIEFPEYTGGSTWDPNKKILINSKPRKYWTKSLKALEKDLISLVASAKEALEQRAFEGLANEVSEIGREIFSTLPAFSNNRFPGASVRRRTDNDKAEKKGKPREEVRILVFVRNEHNVGFTPAEARLQGPGGLDIRKPTGLKGRINFGSQMSAGEYLVTLRLPPNVRLRSANPQRFTLPKDNVGKIIPFDVETGTPPPEVRHRSPSFKAYFSVFEDPDIPWRQFLGEEGIIEINIGCDAFHQAIVDNDEFSKRALIGHFIVQALKEYCDTKEIPLSLTEMSVLFGAFLTKLTSKL